MFESYLFLRGMALSLLLLVCLKLWIQCRGFIAGKLLLGVFLGLAGYLVVPFLADTSWLKYLVVALAISVPAMFWLFSESLFKDWDSRQIKLSWVHVSIVISFLAISFFSHWAGDVMPSAGGSEANDARLMNAEKIAFYLSYLFRIGFVVFAFIAILSQWQNDLVEPRRRLRSIMVVLGAAQILLVTAVELMLAGEAAPLFLEVANSALILMLVAGIAIWLLLIDPESLPVLLGFSNSMIEEVDSAAVHSSTSIAKPTSVLISAEQALPDNSQTSPQLSHPLKDPLKEQLTQQLTPRLNVLEQGWLDALHQHMQDDAGYRNAELTIRSLSGILNIPEHRLRRLINQYLGYRNFNDYLNRLRIAEAQTRLADSAQGHLPILTIAMDVGYASLTPFNRAFKLKHQQTPGEYRREKLQ
ncbi:MAG: AraC family transcriptional regulator [Pseudomonadales bacterium]|nr:AraC family transcriptional regulator [Pseudomonadales bacterium]